MITADSC